MSEHRGGYDLPIAGRPTAEIRQLPDPDRLLLSLASRRFTFSELLVTTGDEVKPGQVLAIDPEHHHVPLLAPMGGIVNTDGAPASIEISHAKQGTPTTELPESFKLADNTPELARERFTLLYRGAWQFVEDLADRSLPCPGVEPAAVVVTTLHLEPFLVRGNVLLKDRLNDFARGLQSLKRLSGGKPLHLIFPDTTGAFAEEAERKLSAIEGVTLRKVPLRYPFDDPKLAALQLGLLSPGVSSVPVWGVAAEGVLAIDQILETGAPCLSRTLTLGGPAIKNPSHIHTVPGYPIDQLLTHVELVPGPTRAVCGGLLRGHVPTGGALGIDTECSGVTVAIEEHKRELFSFAVPGFGKRSYCRCFASTIRKGFLERFTTGLRGEPRPCLSCGYCESVCPAGVLPFLLERYLRHDELEMADRCELYRCIGCGLCSYICTSKIELSRAIVDGQSTVRRELHAVKQQQTDDAS